MVFKVAVIYFSLRGRLVTLANVIAAGARKVSPEEEIGVRRWRPGKLLELMGEALAGARSGGHCLQGPGSHQR